MAQASKKHFGPGAQGKGTGVGGMTDNKAGTVEDNMVLSNRDKSRHSDERGQDSKWIETQQQRDHAANRQTTDEGISQDDER
jgi:hypothetical protein